MTGYGMNWRCGLGRKLLMRRGVLMFTHLHKRKPLIVRFAFSSCEQRFEFNTSVAVPSLRLMPLHLFGMNDVHRFRSIAGQVQL